MDHPWLYQEMRSSHNPALSLSASVDHNVAQRERITQSLVFSSPQREVSFFEKSILSTDPSPPLSEGAQYSPPETSLAPISTCRVGSSTSKSPDIFAVTDPCHRCRLRLRRFTSDVSIYLLGERNAACAFYSWHIGLNRI